MPAPGGGPIITQYLRGTGMPTFVTVFNWRRAHPEFLEQYARAREDQADAHAEEMLDVARQAVNAKSSEEVQGFRLLVDTLKWRAMKMRPKSYGDKVTLDGDLSVRTMTDAEINACLAFLVNQAKRPVLTLVEDSPPPIDGTA
jgi:hypothetical protein